MSAPTGPAGMDVTKGGTGNRNGFTSGAVNAFQAADNTPHGKRGRLPGRQALAAVPGPDRP